MKVRMREMRENEGALKRSLHLWLLCVAVNVLFSTCFMTCEPIALLSSFPTHQGTFRSQTRIQNTAPAIVKAFSESINLMLSIPPGPPLSEPPHSVRPLPINIYSIESKRRRPVIDITTSPPSAVET